MGKIKIDDLCCDEQFINIINPNRWGLTTEQVTNKPITNEKGKVIGKLVEADEDYIYGIVYNAAELYKDPTPVSVEVRINK